jgi:hypothetical protein
VVRDEGFHLRDLSIRIPKASEEPTGNLDAGFHMTIEADPIRNPERCRFSYIVQQDA